MSNKSTIAVIGGGIMGIDIARQLSSKGHIVTILEGADEIGGLAVSARFGEFVWDKFYHVILPDDTLTLKMIEEVGLANEIIWKETKTGFFIDGTYHSMSNVAEFIKFPVINIFDKIRLGITILSGSLLKDYNKLENIPVSDWLIKWAGRNVFEKIWRPLLIAKLGKDYKLSSAAFICATIKRLYGARKKGAKKETFGYVKGGYKKVLDKLRETVLADGINIVTGFKVSEIFQGKENKPIVRSSDGQNLQFDYVVFTLPSTIVASVCRHLSDREQLILNNIKYLGVICVSLLLKRPLTPYYITNITDSKVPFTGVIEMTALVNRDLFDGNSLVYLPKYVNSNDPMFDLSDTDLKEYFIGFLRLMHPGLSNDDILFCQVAKARNVITLPEMGYSSRLPSIRLSSTNIFLINSSFIVDGTLNINETLKISRSYLPKVAEIIKNEE
jgi:protoporphyrinogen oxidase